MESAVDGVLLPSELLNRWGRWGCCYLGLKNKERKQLPGPQRVALREEAW